MGVNRCVEVWKKTIVSHSARFHSVTPGRPHAHMVLAVPLDEPWTPLGERLVIPGPRVAILGLPVVIFGPHLVNLGTRVAILGPRLAILGIRVVILGTSAGKSLRILQGAKTQVWPRKVFREDFKYFSGIRTWTRQKPVFCL